MKDFREAMLILITNTKTKVPRSFTVSGILNQLSSLSPSTVKCTKQVVGIHKIGSMSKEIALELFKITQSWPIYRLLFSSVWYHFCKYRCRFAITKTIRRVEIQRGSGGSVKSSEYFEPIFLINMSNGRNGTNNPASIIFINTKCFDN
ncbi:hypothetical protein NQ317_000112 [Molorchus minor]|uniref:Ribosomal protein S7 n=1 Tax=Molorchus minor TaxID=1323400 RepID=A0ABQ9JK06_9CUCU|nr:hypothetical protein NQ317_000112 [Molorchus minor]